jgi:hypothetical protein
VYQFLTAKGRYPKENVLLLTDTTPEKPTLQNIRRAFGDFLFRKPGRNDMVLIYYAGHGAPEVDAAGTESDGLSKYRSRATRIRTPSTVPPCPWTRFSASSRGSPRSAS